jgi:hypothetical protein
MDIGSCIGPWITQRPTHPRRNNRVGRQVFSRTGRIAYPVRWTSRLASKGEALLFGHLSTTGERDDGGATGLGLWPSAHRLNAPRILETVACDESSGI